MHLSLLSSGTSSDLFDDAGTADSSIEARHHLDGIVRGLVFAAALLAPFALTFAPAALGQARHSMAMIGVHP